MTDYELIEQVATELRREIDALRNDIARLKSGNDSYLFNIWNQLTVVGTIVDGLAEWRKAHLKEHGDV